MTKVTMTVNGKSVSKEVSGNTLMTEFLRDELHLTGTHVGWKLRLLLCSLQGFGQP